MFKTSFTKHIFNAVTAHYSMAVRTFLQSFTNSFMGIFHMLRMISIKFKIFNPIIRPNSVNMMDHFFFSKIPSNMFFHYKTMFRNVSRLWTIRVIRHKNNFIASGVNIKTFFISRRFLSYIIDASIFTITFLRTESSFIFNRLIDKERLIAYLASFLNVTAAPIWRFLPRMESAFVYSITFFRAYFSISHDRRITRKGIITNSTSFINKPTFPVICIFSYLKFTLISIQTNLRTYFSMDAVFSKKYFITYQTSKFSHNIYSTIRRMPCQC